MKKLKPVVLLESFGKKELRAFDEFVSFELKNKSANVRKFWASVYSKERNSLDFDTINSFSRKTLSDFSKIAEKFLMYLNLEKDVFSKSIHLSRELRKRKIRKYFERQVNLLNHIKNIKYADNYNDAVNRLKINREEYLLWSSKDDDNKMKKITDERTLLAEIILVQNVLNENYTDFRSGKTNERKKSLISLNKALEFVRERQNYIRKNYPIIWMMYLLNSSNRRGRTVELLRNLFAYLSENEERLTSENLQISYETLFRIITDLLNSGCTESFSETYSIIKELYKKDTLKRFEFVPPRHIVMFTSVSLAFGDITLAEGIYKKLEKKMGGDETCVLELCSAMIEFSRRNFAKARKLLVSDKSKDPVLYLFSRTFLMKVYYETNELRNIYPLTDTVRHYIQRRKEISDFSKNILLFISGINKLARVKKNTCKGLHSLDSLLSEERLYFHKQWILEKYAELFLMRNTDYQKRPQLIKE